ncbi:MAG TPA: hypothetical protein PLP17_07250, partial [Oligoflexia bacterium]|nr:hypothetical protein [Oligoflexia bacterium]
DRRDERSASAVKQKAAAPGEERADAGRGLHSVVWTRDGETEDEFTPFDYSRPPEKTERRSRELPLEENDQLDWEQNALLASELSVDAPEEEEDFFGFEPNLASSRERRAPEPTRPAPRRPRQAPASQAAAGGFWYFLMFLAVVLITVWYYFRGIQPGTESYGVDDLRLRWESRSPSRMVAVARLALTRGPEQHYAEEIILRSVMSGDTLPGGVDVDLLRIAFNSRWEKSLSAEDRRMALALGLAGLLDGALPTDLGKLSDRHPGVVFAVAASAGRNVSRFLKPIPAVVLTKLPPPYGPAFVKLTMNAADATCADDFVQQFARISTRGVERAQEIAEFLRQDSRVRLVALALMFSADNQLAKPLLDVLVNHPNLSLEQAEVKWAREWKLTQWADLEPGDQLFVLAGVPPSGRLDLENIGKLFMHPAAEIRVYAIQQALDRIKFAHPATWAVMQRVMRQPDMLSPEQLFKLAEILEKPASVSDERIKTWLTSQPPVPLDILTEMLLANSEQAQAMRLDAWIAVYLKGQGWEPDIAVLKRLAQHPDNYTRLFAYNQIFRLNDKDTARVFLRTALNKEKNPAYRRQLESMIGYLK